MNTSAADLSKALLDAGLWVGSKRCRNTQAARLARAGWRIRDVDLLVAEADLRALTDCPKLAAGWIEGDEATLDDLIVALREMEPRTEPVNPFRSDQIDGLSQESRRVTALIAAGNLMQFERWEAAQLAAHLTAEYQLDPPLTADEIPARKGPSDTAKNAIRNMIRRAKERAAKDEWKPDTPKAG